MIGICTLRFNHQSTSFSPLQKLRPCYLGLLEYDMIVKMTESHLDDVIDIHTECFKDSFLTSLDRNFLTCMYDNYISSQLGCAYVCIADGNVIGFIVGTANPSVYYNQLLKKRGLRMIWLALKKVIGNPRILVSIAKRNFSGFFRPDESEESYRRALLDSIAVKPEYWGTGIAQQLIGAFLNDLKTRGVSQVHLGVAAENIRAKRFYEKMGFKNIRKCVDNYGRESNIYQLTL